MVFIKNSYNENCKKGNSDIILALRKCSSVLMLPRKIHRGAAKSRVEFMLHKSATQPQLIVVLQPVNKKCIYLLVD